MFEDITILDETSQIYYIDEKINLIAKPTSSELNIVLPAANDKYIGKTLLYINQLAQVLYLSM